MVGICEPLVLYSMKAAIGHESAIHIFSVLSCDVLLCTDQDGGKAQLLEGFRFRFAFDEVGDVRGLLVGVGHHWIGVMVR